MRITPNRGYSEGRNFPWQKFLQSFAKFIFVSCANFTWFLLSDRAVVP